MKCIGAFTLCYIVCAHIFAQATLQRIDSNSFHSDFLQSIYEPLFDYEPTDSLPIFSWLTSSVPQIHWSSYEGVENDKKYKVYAINEFEKAESDGVVYAMVAYTQGDFALVICSIVSYTDIVEHRFYTYDFYGNVIDSLVFHHTFTTENGHCIMPLSGALLGNLDIKTCEIKWTERFPYDFEKWNLKGGNQVGRRVDSYYSISKTGHFALKKQIICYPKVYTEDDVTTFDFSTKGAKRKAVFKDFLIVGDIENIIEY